MKWSKSSIIIFFATSIFVLFCFGVIYASGSYVSGTEFNPVSWSMRRFSFYRDPMSGNQYSGIRYSGSYFGDMWKSNEFSASFSSTIRPYLNAPECKDDRWDLVKSNLHSALKGEAYVVEILMNVSTRDWQSRWELWTSDHPDRAKLLWPAAQRLTYVHGYAYLTDIFSLAILDQSDVEFETALQNYMRQSLTDIRLKALQDEASGIVTACDEMLPKYNRKQ